MKILIQFSALLYTALLSPLLFGHPGHVESAGFDGALLELMAIIILGIVFMGQFLLRKIIKYRINHHK